MKHDMLSKLAKMGREVGLPVSLDTVKSKKGTPFAHTETHRGSE